MRLLPRFSAACFCSMALLCQAATVTAVHSFGDSATDGFGPLGGLVLGADGFLYGTTQYGGIYGYDPLTNTSNGTIFRVGSDLSYETVYSFTHLNPQTHGNNDGRWPSAALLATPNGQLYGVTPFGGSGDAGAVFAFSPSAGFTELHAFTIKVVGKGVTPHQPNGPLALGSDGRLYGPTLTGGTRAPADGTLFGLGTRGSRFKVLTTFSQLAQLPAGRLLAASDGMLYGIARAFSGGAGGALFRIATDGTQYEVLHQFNYPAEGGFYSGTLVPAPIEGADGFLYGATIDGGPGNVGTLYRVARDGSAFSLLHTFSALDSTHANPDGADIHTSLVFGADGNLYGAASLGGANASGTLYRVAPDGTGFTTLYDFPAVPNPAAQLTGSLPYGDIVFDTLGRLCGITYQGGAYNGGAAYCATIDAP